MNTLQQPPQSSLIVVCKSEGNPDYGQYSPISDPSTVPCDTLSAASEECRRYIEFWDLGGGNWAGGQVYHPSKGLIAQISYNGRVWTPEGWPKATEIPAEKLSLTFDQL